MKEQRICIPYTSKPNQCDTLVALFMKKAVLDSIEEVFSPNEVKSVPIERNHRDSLNLRFRLLDMMGDIDHGMMGKIGHIILQPGRNCTNFLILVKA